MTRTTNASPAHLAAFASKATSHPVLIPREVAGHPHPGPPIPARAEWKGLSCRNPASRTRSWAAISSCSRHVESDATPACDYREWAGGHRPRRAFASAGYPAGWKRPRRPAVDRAACLRHRSGDMVRISRRTASSLGGGSPCPGMTTLPRPWSTPSLDRGHDPRGAEPGAPADLGDRLPRVGHEHVEARLLVGQEGRADVADRLAAARHVARRVSGSPPRRTLREPSCRRVAAVAISR